MLNGEDNVLSADEDDVQADEEEIVQPDQQQEQEEVEVPVDEACVICLHARANSVVIPCGHICICDTCATFEKLTSPW